MDLYRQRIDYLNNLGNIHEASRSETALLGPLDTVAKAMSKAQQLAGISASIVEQLEDVRQAALEGDQRAVDKGLERIARLANGVKKNISHLASL